MDLTRLPELKQKLLYEQRLSVVWEFFLDHFAENLEFIAAGEEIRHALVEAIIAQIAEQLFADDGAVGNLLLARLSGPQFIHGGFSMGGRPGGVIYFEDDQVGLLAVAQGPGSDEVKFARFSGQQIKRFTEPSQN